MANLRFVDGAGDDAKYRKATGVGSDADPFITDVSVSSIAPGTAASSLGKAEDAAHTSGDVGVMPLVVRSDAGGTLAGTDGDYAPLQVDASGALRVTGGGGGTEYTEDAVAAANPVGGATILVRQDTPASLVTTDGDNVAQRGTNYGAAFTQIVSSAGAFVDSFGGGTQYDVDTALGATPKGTLAVAKRDDALSALTPIEGDAVELRTDANGALWVIPSGTTAVSAASLPLPSGASTAAKQPALGTAGTPSADVISVQGVASMTALKVDGSAVTQPVSAASLPLPTGAATETTLSALNTKVTACNTGAVVLAAGTAAYGKLAANSGVDIGDVDVTSLPATSNAGATAKTSDYDTGAGTDTVTMMGVALPASGGAVAGGTATNPLRTDPTGTTTQPVSGTVTANLGTIAGAALETTLGSVKTAVELIDNAVSGAGFNVTQLGGAAVPIGAGLEATAVRVTLPTDGTGVVKLGAGTAEIGKLAAGSANIGDVDILTIAAGDNNIGNVDVVTMPNVTLNAGTNTNEVVGDAAHDAAIAGNPVRVGLRAVSADITAVTTGDTCDAISDLVGKQVVLPYAIPENFIKGATAAITGTAATEVFAAQAAGIRSHLTQITVTNSHATVGTVVEIWDGITATGTLMHRGYAAPAGGGFSCSFVVPLRGTAATAVNAYNITTGSNTYVSASGYKGV